MVYVWSRHHKYYLQNIQSGTLSAIYILLSLGYNIDGPWKARLEKL